MADSAIEPVEDCDELEDLEMVRLQEQLDAANERADAEARRANAANQRADVEAERADAANQRADAAKQRADTATAELDRIRTCLRLLKLDLPCISQPVPRVSCRVQACL